MALVVGHTVSPEVRRFHSLLLFLFAHVDIAHVRESRDRLLTLELSFLFIDPAQRNFIKIAHEMDIGTFDFLAVHPELTGRIGCFELSAQNSLGGEGRIAFEEGNRPSFARSIRKYRPPLFLCIFLLHLFSFLFLPNSVLNVLIQVQVLKVWQVLRVYSRHE